jgi:parvulin-like peptidyl-prolyl isomerase
MKRTLLALALAAVAVPLFASDSFKLIARVNGREITNADLDAQWERVPAKLQAEYLKNGGKAAFLDNYISKQLMVMDAVASGFAKKIGVPDELDMAGESTLFDRYVREVVAAPIVTEGEMQKVYTENRAQFTAPEQARLSTIRVLKNANNPDAAKEALASVVVEIFSARTALASRVATDQLLDALAVEFGKIAQRVSDDPSAAKGGDLGWVALHTLDPRIANAARAMKPGAISGILESKDAYQVVLLHEYRPAGIEPYETAQDAIREYLMARNSRKVMQAVKEKTAQLRAAGKVEVFAENLK